MKQPTLQQLIEQAENTVTPEHWYRKSLIPEVFIGMSKSSVDNYCNEMEEIPEFAEGIVKPGHSSTYVHMHTFIWYLKWKHASRYGVKVKPREVL